MRLKETFGGPNKTEPVSACPPHESSGPPWDVYSAFAAITAGYILVPLMISQALLLINPFLDTFQQFLIQQTITVATWIGVFAFLHWRYGHLSSHLGLRTDRPFAYETLKLTLLTLGIILGLNLLWRFLDTVMPGLLPAGEPSPYAGFSRVELQVFSLFAVLVAPVQEELIFRGLVQSTLRKIFSPISAILLTSLVFLSLHGSYFGNIKALTQVLLLGFCFSVWRERTHSLLPSIVAHLFNNGLAYLLLQAASSH